MTPPFYKFSPMNDLLINKAGCKGITVSQLTDRLKNVINTSADLQGQWVVAELVEARASGGHVYLDMAEKNSEGKITAKIRGTIWSSVVHRMKELYGARMREIIQPGNEILVYGSVSYSPVYSLGFNILDIDPTYQRDTSKIQAEILAILSKEGLLEENKCLVLPEVLQRVAVISAPGAAGYGDFVNQLFHNPYNLRFSPTLFAATMQGVNVSASVRDALNEIELRQEDFDCVVIIRGGGATADLAGFDELQLARAVALFPLPVIVGIGHERDNTVLDFIANKRVKTPTAAAEFLIARNAGVWAHVLDLTKSVASYVEKAVNGETVQLEFYRDRIPSLARMCADTAKARLAEITAALPLLVRNRLITASSVLERASRVIESAGMQRLASASMRLENAEAVIRRDLEIIIKGEEQRLSALSDKVRILSPENVLARGYSISRVDGVALRDASRVASGTLITTTLHKGEITSISK